MRWTELNVLLAHNVSTHFTNLDSRDSRVGGWPVFSTFSRLLLRWQKRNYYPLCESIYHLGIWQIWKSRFADGFWCYYSVPSPGLSRVWNWSYAGQISFFFFFFLLFLLLIPFLTRESLSKSPKATTHFPFLRARAQSISVTKVASPRVEKPVTVSIQPLLYHIPILWTGSSARSFCSWGPWDDDAEEQGPIDRCCVLTTSSLLFLFFLPLFLCVSLKLRSLRAQQSLPQ